MSASFAVNHGGINLRKSVTKKMFLVTWEDSHMHYKADIEAEIG
jgi:hypothetical protein